jgi:hypothetical protein
MVVSRIEPGIGAGGKQAQPVRRSSARTNLPDYYARDVSPGELSHCLATLTACLGLSSGVQVHERGSDILRLHFVAGCGPRKQVDLSTLLQMGNSMASYS